MISRTLCRRAVGANGFWRKAMPGSSMPWWTMAFAVYPDMESTRIPDRIAMSLLADSLPLEHRKETE
jgi:Flp pilus assembly protein protease CpaA